MLQYRPSTREVVRTIQGPLAAQHDVDILNDSTLVIFNNATQENFGRYTSNKDKYPISKDQAELAQWHSELAHFNLRTGAFTSPFQAVMAQEGIMTFTEGLQDMLPRGPRLWKNRTQAYFGSSMKTGCFTRTSWRAITLATIISPTGPAL